MNCPACQSSNPKNARFCKKCGQAMPEKADDSPVVCRDCQSSNPAHAKFCKKCGQSLAKPDDKAPPSERAVEAEDTPALFTPIRQEKAKSAASKQPPKKKAEQPEAPKAAQTNEPEISLEKGQVVAREVGTGLVQRLKLAKTNPRALLEPARGRFNFLEILGVVAVCAMFAGLYFLGLLRFGPSMMLRSGAPVFLAYVIGLLVALKSFRGLLDRLLMKVFGWLGRFSPRGRVLLGLALPIAYAFLDSKDRNMGFQSAGFTVTVATLLAHTLIRSTAFRSKAP